jgi:hypothetical protein
MKQTMKFGKAITSGFNKLHAVLSGVGLFIVALWMISYWLGFDIESAIDKKLRPENVYIESVKGGSLQQYSQEPLGKVLDTVFTDTKWSYYEADGKHFVQFDGLHYTAEGNNVAKIKFEVKEGDIFEVSSIAVDGREFFEFEYVPFMNIVFNEYQSIGI